MTMLCELCEKQSGNYSTVFTNGTIILLAITKVPDFIAYEDFKKDIKIFGFKESCVCDLCLAKNI